MARATTTLKCAKRYLTFGVGRSSLRVSRTLLFVVNSIWVESKAYFRIEERLKSLKGLNSLKRFESLKESTCHETRFPRSFLLRLINDLWQDLRKIPPVFLYTVAFLVGIKCGYLCFSFKTALILLPISAAVVYTFLGLVCRLLPGGRFSRASHVICPGRADLRTAAKHGVRVNLLLVCALFFSIGAMRSSYDRYSKLSDLSYVYEADKPLQIRCRIGNLISVKRLKGRAARYRMSVGDPVVLPQNKALTLPLFLYWYGDYDPSVTTVPSAGENWLFKGRLYCSKDRGYKSSLLLNSGEKSSRRCDPIAADSWRQRLVKFRREASRRISYGIEDWRNVVEINQAVLLGFKENIPRNLKKVFACSGTIHVFAISGLHIALIASVLVVIVSTCGAPRYYWIFLLTPLLLAYAFATGMRPSAVRATLMAIFFFAAPFLGRRFNALSALATAAFVVHLFAPANIYDIGCILSFSVMLGLVVLFKPVCRLIERLFRVDTFKSGAAMYSAAGEEKSAARQQHIANFLSFFAGLCAVTIAAWLASMPLSAYFFGRITPGGLIANLVISPCALMLVISGVVGLVASFVSYALAAIFNNAAGVFTLVMIKTAGFISACPGANFKVSSFPAWLVWCWFGLLFLVAWLLRRWGERRDDGLEWMTTRMRDEG